MVHAMTAIVFQRLTFTERTSSLYHMHTELIPHISFPISCIELKVNLTRIGCRVKGDVRGGAHEDD